MAKWLPTPGTGNVLSEDERLLASLAAHYDVGISAFAQAVEMARDVVDEVIALRPEVKQAAGLFSRVKGAS